MNRAIKNSEKDENANLARRLIGVMVVAIVLGVVISLPFQAWQVTGGLLLGGGLSLLNFHWLHSAIVGAFSRTPEGARPQIRLLKYVLRYLVIGASVFIAYKLKLVSLPATMAGLSSFVVALFAEAFRETYFIIFHREESY